jgi:hypothetical protein
VTAHGPIRAERPTPSRAKLIALLIEERARVIASNHGWGRPPEPGEEDRDQARREIEAEVLTTTKAKI